MPVPAMDTRKIPAISPVANTDLVSRYTQKVTANHTVKLITDTTRVLSSRCRNVRCGPVRRSSAGDVRVSVMALLGGGRSESPSCGLGQGGSGILAGSVTATT